MGVGGTWEVGYFVPYMYVYILRAFVYVNVCVRECVCVCVCVCVDRVYFADDVYI